MPDNALRRFWAVYVLELRLTVSHWSYLVFLAIWSVFIIAQYSGNDFAFLAGLSGFIGGIISLIALFFAGFQATRVARNRFEALELALPTGLEVSLARWLATGTTVASLLIAPLVVLAIAPRARLESDTVWRVLGIPLLMIPFATGLIWMLQTLLGIRRWMYPFFAAFWLAGGMIPNTLQTTDAHGLRLPVPGAHLLDFISLNQGRDSLWGTLTQRPLP
ncbi:MAG: hypothetical protein IT323_19620, partial [Anaerolineae bacterium]|nr:hypothetical protein [Anaerolineae bacterium]